MMLNKLYWYMQRPKLYPELLRRMRKKFFLFNKKIDSKSSINWCEHNSKNVIDVLRGITKKNEILKLNVLYPDIIENAKEIINEIPTYMAGYNKDYDDTYNIVDRSGGSEIDLIYNLCEYINANKVIETGVAYGWSTLAVLLSINKRKKSRLISIDMPYPLKNNDSFVGCIVPEYLRKKWDLFRYADREGIPIAKKIMKKIDLCHYDSDKSYEGRIWAYPILWGILNPGGMLISDDISDNFAFKDFADSLNLKPYILKRKTPIGVKYIGILVKP